MPAQRFPPASASRRGILTGIPPLRGSATVVPAPLSCAPILQSDSRLIARRRPAAAGRRARSINSGQNKLYRPDRAALADHILSPGPRSQ